MTHSTFTYHNHILSAMSRLIKLLVMAFRVTIMVCMWYVGTRITTLRFKMNPHCARDFCWVTLKNLSNKGTSKVKVPIVVRGTSCCTTLSFSHFPHDNVLFLLGFRNHKGWLTSGVCLDVPKSDCLTQFPVKQGPRGPQ